MTDSSRFGNDFDADEEAAGSEEVPVEGEGRSGGGVVGEAEDFEKRAASRLLVFVRDAAATAEGVAVACRGRERVETGEETSNLGKVGAN